VGAFGELRRPVDAASVAAYAALLGDSNPVHLDAAFARDRTRWGRPIAHGMLSAGLIGTIFGASIPGSIYVSQSLKFRKPVYVGDGVTARVEVLAVRAMPAARLVTCATTVRRDSDGEVVVDGQAVVMLPVEEEGKGGGGEEGAGGGGVAAQRRLE
jgi:3-hydroxybutyryl-CoA dehydratase